MVGARIWGRHEGDDSAREAEYSRFVEEFLPSLLKGAYLLLHDIGLAEDATQATLLQVFRHWDEARVAPAPYSRTTLVNVCREHWRRGRRRPQEVLSADAVIGDGVASFSDAWVDREALEQALGELPNLQREVLVLRFFFDFSVAEVAEALKIPEGTVKSTTHRGLRQLRGLLDASESEARAC